MKINKKFFMGVLGFVTSLMILGGCTSEETSIESSDTSNENSNEVQKVKVGIGNAAFPYCYIDENGEIAGYDYELLQAVDERLDDYEFEYEQLEFAALLTAIESGQVDMGSHNISKNPEREEVMMFSDSITLVSDYHIIWLEENGHDFQDWKDLAGYKVYSKTGSSDSTMMQEFNEENPELEDIEIILGDQGDDVVVQSLKNGETDAKISSALQVYQMAENNGEIFAMSDEPIYVSEGYFAYNLENEELKIAIDDVLKELDEEGAINQLLEEFINPYLYSVQ